MCRVSSVNYKRLLFYTWKHSLTSIQCKIATYCTRLMHRVNKKKQNVKFVFKISEFEGMLRNPKEFLNIIFPGTNHCV